MPRLNLDVKKRTILGRKVKKLRREGLLPANLYGKTTGSIALEVPVKDFKVVFSKAGESSLVDLKLDGEARPVLIHNVQFHPVTDEPIHADFHQVSLKEKTTAMIPIELIGEAPAVGEKLGILIQTLAEAEVEALPQDLPEKLEVDISKLAQVGDAVTVADLKVNKEKVEVKANLEETVAKIDALAEEEVAPAPAEGEEGAAVESEEGGVVKEGEGQEGGEEKRSEEGEKKEE